MTLTTHAVVGAAAASLFPQVPVAAFAAGFMSHFVIDAIPHWNESQVLRSFEHDPRDNLNNDMRIGIDFIRDLAVLSVDAGLGIGLSVLVFSVWLFHFPPVLVLLGAAAGMSPDALQFLYFKTQWRFMRPLQKFHGRIQKEFESYFTIGIELALMAVIIGALKLFFVATVL